MLFAIFASIFTICVSYIIVSLYTGRRPQQFPSGPFTWPIFGNLFQIGSEPYKNVMKMREKYGDIVAIDFGTKRSIFINEYKLLREIFNFPIANARPLFCHCAEEGTGILRGIAFTSGQTWQEQRRFAFSYIQTELRDGENKEKLVLQEVDDLIKEIKQSCGSPINTRNLFNFATVNYLWRIIAGKRYSADDTEFNKMIKHVTAMKENPVAQGFVVFFPKFSKMFPRISGYNSIRKDFLPICEFMRNIVKEHKESFQEGIQRDFVASSLQKIKSTTDPKSSFYGDTGERNLEHNLVDIFLGGTDSVGSTLRWCVFLLAHFREEQRKLIDVIRQFILDNQRPISLQDLTRLPYVEAVIQEVLRFSAIAPLGMFHEALEGFDFHGYKIPKGTMIVANQFGILHDPEVWGDPENFKPQRFLTEDGMKVVHHPAVVPFGVGRRICPGESFARDELFLFVTSLFQNFSVEFDSSAPIPPLTHFVGPSLLPPDHKIVFNKSLE